jgi:hypothetical protein
MFLWGLSNYAWNNNFLLLIGIVWVKLSQVYWLD